MKSPGVSFVRLARTYSKGCKSLNRPDSGKVTAKGKGVRLETESGGSRRHGVYQPTTEGTPQGGPLSPLLSNIVLNELDRELERRGHPFVRYADDSLIFCKSKRGAERVCESLTKFIEKKLHLKVNLDKTEVGYVRGMKYLGHTFYKTGEG